MEIKETRWSSSHIETEEGGGIEIVYLGSDSHFLKYEFLSSNKYLKSIRTGTRE